MEFLRRGANEEGVKAVINELLGHASGAAHGKGGSMHMYEPEKNSDDKTGDTCNQITEEVVIVRETELNSLLIGR